MWYLLFFSLRIKYNSSEYSSAPSRVNIIFSSFISPHLLSSVILVRFFFPQKSVLVILLCHLIIKIGALKHLSWPWVETCLLLFYRGTPGVTISWSFFLWVRFLREKRKLFWFPALKDIILPVSALGFWWAKDTWGTGDVGHCPSMPRFQCKNPCSHSHCWYPHQAPSIHRDECLAAFTHLCLWPHCPVVWLLGAQLWSWSWICLPSHDCSSSAFLFPQLVLILFFYLLFEFCEFMLFKASW